MGVAVHEILTESVQHIQHRAPIVLGLALAGLAAIAAESLLARGAKERARRWIRRGLVAVAIGVGLLFAWRVLWLADDAFISFRYARNLARGNGLVFNVGEWVEGYTNFLWTALLGGAGWLGLDIPYTSLVATLLCFVATLVLVGATVRRVSTRPVVIPFSALALAGLSPFFTFASSGLETMPLAFLLALAMWTSTLRRGPLAAGLVLVAAAMTRPDQLLSYGCMGLALAAEDLVFGEGGLVRRADLRRLAVFAAPLVLVFVPYFLIRWKVYGDPFPNTYYAKSGGLAYVRQGWVYLVHFLATTGAWLWFPLFLFSIVGRPRGRDEWRLRVFAFLASAVHGAYVVRVGGDFMEHRFFVPLLPVIAVGLELGIRRWLSATGRAWPKRVLLAGASLAIAFALVPVRLIGPYEKRWYLAAEQTFYPVKTLFPLRVGSGYMDEGKRLHRIFVERGLDPRIAADAIGLLSYYSDLPIVDALGLTSRRIAHKPIVGRGRPGHEKGGAVEDLLAEGAILAFWPPWGEQWSAQTEVRIDGERLHFVRLDPKWAAALAKIPGATIPNPAFQIATLVRTAPRGKLIAALSFYRGFLAGRGDLEALIAPLRERLGEIADFEDGKLPVGAILTGDVLEVKAGAPPAGATGRGWLASRAGEKTGGRLEIPIAAIEADEIRFALGGPSTSDADGSRGTADDLRYVELRVDGAGVRRARPSGGAGLKPVSWDVSEFRGRPATLIVVDEDPRAEMGILVDGIHFVPKMGDIRGRVSAWRRGGQGDPAALLREAEDALPAGDRDVQALSLAVLVRWPLDELPEGAVVEGEAFAKGPLPGKARWQTEIVGQQGARLLNSFFPDDSATGRVLFPEMILSGGPISLLVGGGDDCKATYVGLEVEGKVVSRVCGKGDEVLRPAVLETKRWVGKRGRLVVADESTVGWGHILVDDVIVFRSGPVTNARATEPFSDELR
ncbi:hypothetical protein [Vulgatibacter incomptus]|uniref:Glycosyltransferase RgtA/B/C/D-like domain-containing protein n=1 Tax=Vulgatibacter incomptus TaxID=1391653 RepID=A0A0K1P8I3_9BACT|nr:hypothetical protein [Vulgatibacter incomptus]AKU89812.1 hypothetical protein AKJ08_0199 [Vulgatibacter incomptus]